MEKKTERDVFCRHIVLYYTGSEEHFPSGGLTSDLKYGGGGRGG